MSSSIDRLIEFFIDEGDDWLSDFFSIDWLIDWPVGCVIEWLIDWLIGRLVVRLIDWLIDWIFCPIQALQTMVVSAVNARSEIAHVYRFDHGRRDMFQWESKVGSLRRPTGALSGSACHPGGRWTGSSRENGGSGRRPSFLIFFGVLLIPVFLAIATIANRPVGDIFDISVPVSKTIFVVAVECRVILEEMIKWTCPWRKMVNKLVKLDRPELQPQHGVRSWGPTRPEVKIKSRHMPQKCYRSAVSWKGLRPINQSSKKNSDDLLPLLTFSRDGCGFCFFCPIVCQIQPMKMQISISENIGKSGTR